MSRFIVPQKILPLLSEFRSINGQIQAPTRTIQVYFSRYWGGLVESKTVQPQH